MISFIDFMVVTPNKARSLFNKHINGDPIFYPLFNKFNILTHLHNKYMAEDALVIESTHKMHYDNDKNFKYTSIYDLHARFVATMIFVQPMTI